MDNSPVITVPTSRSDRFYFSRKFDPAVIVPIFVKAIVLSRTIQDIPILPNVVSKLEDELFRRSIFGTAAIEGNPLSEEEVVRILSAGENIETTLRAEKEIANLKSAYNFVKSLTVPDPSFSITEEVIQRIHALIIVGIVNDQATPGQYRHVKRKVGDRDHGGTYVPPKFHRDISLLMREFCEWMNSEEMKKENPVVRAAAAHYHLGMIHPFFDGNGRTARLVEAFILQMSGMKYAPVMLSNYYYRNIHDYYRVFSLARKNPDKEITPFLEFVGKGLVASLEEIKSRVLYTIRIFTLNDYYQYLRKEKTINQRQYDLITILLKDPSLPEIAEFDLHGNPPYHLLYKGRSERTVHRDVKKLVDNKLLRIKENGKYELNINILDSL